MTHCGKKVNIQPKAMIANNVSIGDYSGVGTKCLIQGNVVIGDHVMMGLEVLIYTQNHNFSNVDINIVEQVFSLERGVKIGNNVWSGAKVIILSGVTIGEVSVIGADSVVSKDVPLFTIFAGNSGKVVKNRNSS